MESGRSSVPPSQEISKKHKLPAVMLPPPSQRQPAQLVQTVAPLKSTSPEAETNCPVVTVDLSMPPPTQIPKKQPETNSNEGLTKMVQLNRYEQMLFNYIRHNKIPISKVMELVSSANLNNQTEGAYPPIVCDSVLKNIEAISESNKSALKEFLKRSELKADEQNSLDTIRKQVKEDVMEEVKLYVTKELDERFYNYSLQNKRSPEVAPPAAVAKKSKISHQNVTPKQVLVPGNVPQDHQQHTAALLESSTERPLVHHQQLQWHQQQAQRSVPIPGHAEATEIQGEITLQNQYYAINQMGRRNQQNPEVQVQTQDFQTGEYTIQPAHWPLDPRLRMHMMRTMQQPHAMPNTHWGNSYYNGQGQH